MKIDRLFMLLAVCVLAFAACQSSSSTTADMAKVRAEIQQLENAWAEALNTRDIDALMALYADDAVSMVNNGPILTGKDAIRTFQEAEWKSGPQTGTYAFETLDLYGDGETITEVGTSTFKDAAGNTIRTGKYVAVFKKQDGKYLCVREIYNDDQATLAVTPDKSIHLFDLPADITEAQWSSALAEMNSVIAGLGYPGAGYYLYKTEDPETKNYRYYFEGVWPDDEAYAKIHENPAYLKASEKLGPLYDKIAAVQIYRRMSRVQ